MNNNTIQIKHIQLFDDIDTDELSLIQNTINECDNGDYIYLEMCNGGGSVFHGIAIADMLENARNTRGISSVANVWGLAASAASLVALSCDIINISPHGSLMYHSAWNASGDVDDGIKSANKSQLSILSNRIKKLSEKDFDGTDHWISAQEAVDLGIADSIIGHKNSDSKVTNALKIVAKLNTFSQGDLKMENENEKLLEEVKEEKIEEQHLEAEDAPKTAEDILEAIVDRLEAIEHRLSVLEGEGKKQDDEMAECGDEKEQRLNALYAKLLKPSACIKKVNAKSDKDLQKDLDDFNKRVKISDYIR